MTTTLEQVNRARYVPGQRAGHYESFFQRANHPTRPLAFWIRYTLFHPHQRPEDAIGELWAIFFDGEQGQHAVAKTKVPLAQCRFAPDAFAVRVGDATLEPGALRGEASSAEQTIAWDLRYGGAQPPAFLLPRRL
ncbi:MAG: hypothetical protein ACRDIB_07270, partial [Ardenticatenaceae bacterium]